MKRSWTCLGAMLGTVAVLGGCQAAFTASPGGSEPGAASPSAAASSGAPSATTTTIKLVWGFTGGDQAAYEAVIKEFNSTHPDVQVQVDTQPWDTIATTTPAAFASGQGPDIVTPDYNEATVLEYVKAGTILPLDDLLGTGANQIDPAALPKAITDGYSIDGKLYAAPADFRTLMLYYNKDLLSEAGVGAPPATMNELRAVAKQLTKAGAGQYGMAIPDHETIAVWPILIWAEGGEIIKDGCSALSEPATIAAVQKWADAIINDKISPVGLSGGDAGNLVAAGKAAMEINGPWEIGLHTGAKISFDVVKVPQGAGPAVTLSSAVPFVVNKATQHKDAVYEFLAWWAGKDGQRKLALGVGEPPARTDMADDPELATNPWVAKFSSVADAARPWLAGVPSFSKVQDAFYNAIGEIERGSPVEETLKQAAQQTNTILGCQ
jgi:multiple sugar transport system substrate-binding protein